MCKLCTKLAQSATSEIDLQMISADRLTGVPFLNFTINKPHWHWNWCVYVLIHPLS
jgi:hypothetical protein